MDDSDDIASIDDNDDIDEDDDDDVDDDVDGDGDGDGDDDDWKDLMMAIVVKMNTMATTMDL